MVSPLRFLLIFTTTLPLSTSGNPFESHLRKYDTVKVYQLSGRSRRSIHHRLKDERSVTVTVDGPSRSWTLSLLLNSDLIAPGFTLKHFNKQTGKEIVTEDTHNCYYHGKVVDIPNSHVIASTCSGLRGLVYDGNETFHIQPSELTPDEFSHILFQLDDMKDKQFPRTCGNTNDEIVPSVRDIFKKYRVQQPYHHLKRRASTEYVVELTIVMDNAAYQELNSNASRVKEYGGQVANTVDGIYKRLDMGFRIALIGIEFWSAGDRITIHSDAGEMLSQFSDYVGDTVLQSNIRPDSTQFITGIDFEGSTVGMAHIKTMCSGALSSGVNQYSSLPEELAAVMAHEMGHTFGLNHDDGRDNCACSDPNGCIMSASSSGPVRDYNFSECSKSDLWTNLRKGVGHCLYNVPTRLYFDPFCGNGFKEPGEECDCGAEDECAINDPCCQPGKCLLKETASCGEGDCCQNCQFKTTGVRCRDAVNDCDFPEYCGGNSSECPLNIYKQDGTNCTDAGDMGYCYQATCQTHDSQCATLWGSDGKDAPLICYSEINTEGSLYGHCGKASNNSFIACTPSDVRCGKLQCSASERFPIIGSSRQSTSYRFNGVNCRGAAVSLGDDVPDPGVVQDGTKCGENKICLANHCVTLSVLYEQLGIQMCPANTKDGVCSGNGVCTNINQCYCNNGWAPPFCDKPGDGGIEGFPGPMNEEESSNSGAIAGAVIGSLLASVVIVVGLVYVFRHRLGAFFKGNGPQHNKSYNNNTVKDGPTQPPRYSNIHSTAPTRLANPPPTKAASPPPARPANPPPARPANLPPARPASPANPPPARPASPPSKTLTTNNPPPIVAGLKMSPRPTNRQPPVVRPTGKPPDPPTGRPPAPPWKPTQPVEPPATSSKPIQPAKPAPPMKPVQPTKAVQRTRSPPPVKPVPPVAGAKPVLPTKPKS